MTTSLGRAVIGWPRHDSGITYSGGAFSASYPVGNLADQDELSRVARTTDLLTASLEVIGTVDSGRVRAGSFTLVDDNISAAGFYRLQVYSDAARTTTSHDTGLLRRWPRTYPSGSEPWGGGHVWTGRPNQADLANKINTLGVLIPGGVRCAAFKWTFADPSNPAGYLQFGYSDVAMPWQVTYSFDDGMQIGAPSRTLMQQSKGGPKRFERLQSAIQLRGQITHMPRDELMATAWEQGIAQDINKPFVINLFPDDATFGSKTILFMRHLERGLFSHVTDNYYTMPFAAEQVL